MSGNVILDPDQTISRRPDERRPIKLDIGSLVLIAYGLYGLVYFGVAFRGWGGQPASSVFVSFAIVPARLLPAFLAFRAARKLAKLPRLRRAWLGIGAAIVTLWIADVVYIVIPGGPFGAIFPAWGDLIRLAFYPCGTYVVFAGSRVYLQKHQERYTIWLDAATVLVASSMLMWFFIFESGAILTRVDPISIVVATLSPCGDLALLLGLTIVAVKQSDPNVRLTIRLLLLGVLVYLVGDLLNAIQSLAATFHPGTLVDVMWVGGGALVAGSARAAVAWNRSNSLSIGSSNRDRASTTWFPYFFIAAGFGLFLDSTRTEWGNPRFEIGVGVVVLTAIMVARQILVVRDNARLVQEARAEISVRLDAEARLAALGRRLELILESAGEGMFGIDQSGRVVFVNSMALSMLASRSDESLGQHVLTLVRHTSATGIRYDEQTSPILLSLRDGVLHQASGEVIQRADGSSFPVEFESTPIREDGAIVGAVVTFRDITQRVNLEVELRQSQKLEAVGRLAAGIAHELNTPIQFVGDNTRFLRDGMDQAMKVLERYAAFRDAFENASPAAVGLLDDVRLAEAQADLEYLAEEFPKAFDQTLDGIARVTSIVRALKEFAHPDSKDQAPADLNQALHTTLTVARNELKYIAQVETDLGSIPLVNCYLGDLNQVFLNLLVNAAHAIADAGRSGQGVIRVQTYGDADQVSVTITDNGCGIPDAIRSRVFDPFFTTKEVGRGSGQGLAIARSIVVDKHRGSLTYVSEVGVGTTFTVSLPTAGRALDSLELAA